MYVPPQGVFAYLSQVTSTVTDRKTGNTARF